MDGKTVLFGVDSAALLLALWKLIVDKAKLSKEVEDWGRALVVAGAVLLTGLQVMGVVLGPESEQWVLLGMSVTAAFLVTMGYGPGTVAVVRATSDLLRYQAFKVRGGISAVNMPEAEKGEYAMGLISRYGITLRRRKR